MQIKEGITRTVFVFKNKVVKVPTLNYGWEYFLKGLLANLREVKTWKTVCNYPEGDRHLLLCPVSFCFPGGWFLIMPRADMERHQNEIRDLPNNGHTLDFVESFYKKWFDADLDGDEKPDNFGYYQGRLVKVDYGS